jgi:hypothetical protein
MSTPALPVALRRAALAGTSMTAASTPASTASRTVEPDPASARIQAAVMAGSAG